MPGVVYPEVKSEREIKDAIDGAKIESAVAGTKQSVIDACKRKDPERDFIQRLQEKMKARYG